jgi:hypothetical protein
VPKQLHSRPNVYCTLLQNKSVPGNIAITKEESVWAALKDTPIQCEDAPMLTLPLHVHITQGDFVGVPNLTAFDIETKILPYFVQAAVIALVFSLNVFSSHYQIR